MTAPISRLPAREDVTARAAVSPDPAQQARRALLWYLATSTPMPHPGMPNHEDIPRADLIRILLGLVNNGPVSDGWENVVDKADALAAYLAVGGSANPTGQRYMENYLADAINSAAPDREA